MTQYELLSKLDILNQFRLRVHDRVTGTLDTGSYDVSIDALNIVDSIVEDLDECAERLQEIEGMVDLQSLTIEEAP